MRIGIATVQVPFIRGGAERHSYNLCTALQSYGHEATEIRIPFKWYPTQTLVDHVLAAKLIDIGESNGTPIDLLIGLKFPAYLLRHPNKVFWILHQHRQAYDLWDLGLSELLGEPDGLAVREFIRAEDQDAFENSEGRLFTNSANVSKRLMRYLRTASSPLYHPPPYADLLHADSFSDYIFAPSRIGSSKRQKLLIEALARTRSRIRLVFAGQPDVPGYDRSLHDHAGQLGVADRLTWLGPIPDSEMADHYAKARGVAFVPIDEDYGYVTLEAMLSRRPVVTTTDSGGPLEFIRHRQEGLVVAPDATALAAAFDELADDARLAERMGAAGFERYSALNINWTRVVEALTGTATATTTSIAKSVPTPEGMPTVSFCTENESIDSPSLDMAAARKHFSVPEPGPVKPAFAQFPDLYAAYDLRLYGSVKQLTSYYGTHWQRYLATLSFLPARSRLRCLDIGVFPPFVFASLVKASLPDAEISAVWEGPDYRAKTISRSSNAPSFDIDVRHANVETQSLPFADGAFDVVFALEILEHLAIDPLFFFQQISRVLKPSGLLVLSTPNIASHRGVAKVLRNEAPYSFGLFVPTGGVYGRHNREYTAGEVAQLGKAAGFECERLITADVYDDFVDADALRVLIERKDALQLRGETIFYAARRGNRIGTDIPDNLFVGDPNQLDGYIAVERYDAATGLGVFSIANRSRAPWLATGDQRLSLYVDWFDNQGTLRHDGLQLPLEEPVMPGGLTRVPFAFGPVSIDGQRSGMEGEARVEIFQIGSGRLRGAGRANLVRVPCSEQAYLQLRERMRHDA
ncbi:glycosyltransferase [Reyranella sp.]|uniref:glycosyltransferase n=1 Tax=Reyranella sp. TaxID=1929291 RepID=UPI003D1042B6